MASDGSDPVPFEFGKRCFMGHVRACEMSWDQKKANRKELLASNGSLTNIGQVFVKNTGFKTTDLIGKYAVQIRLSFVLVVGISH